MTIEDLQSLDPATIDRIQDIASRMPNVTPDEAAFLEAHMPQQVNTCGSCTLCCTAPSISGKDVESPLTGPKPAGQACEYCDLSSGCRVYERRPSICKGYMCFYALGMVETFPADHGVCWTAQPVPELEDVHPSPWIAMGHTHSVKDAMTDLQNRSDIAYMMTVMRPAAVVLRDALEVLQIVVPPDFNGYVVGPDTELIFRSTPIDQDDPIKARWIEDEAETFISTLR